MKRYLPALCLLLSACSSVWPDTSGPIPPAVQLQGPPTQEALQKGLHDAVTETKMIAPVEVSALRQTAHGPGGYFLCLREAAPSTKTVIYSVFFDDIYKGSRQSVILDHCEQEQYARVN
ncbi:hypothetical protein [Bradyrhizobium sp.]|uniref:hypothetical protein n=1 Tax=Bradyrhizobium sp. TaxID=376 RepID=UPI0039E720B7